MNNIITMECLMKYVKEVKQLMESQDVKIVQGPDVVSNWITKECSNQVAGKFHSIIEFTKREQSTAKLEKSKYCAHSQRSR